MNNFKNNFLILISVFILLGTVFFILEKTRYVTIIDSDILWHIKTGEWIIEHKQIPKKDVFSWHDNLNWMPHEWLYDVILSISYNIIGIKAIPFIAMILLIIRIGFVSLYNIVIKKENIFAYSIFVPILLISEGYTWAVGRPLELTIILLLINLLTFIKNRKEIYYYISFGISCFLIANLHGGTIQAIFAQMFIFIGIDIIYYLRNKTIENKKNIIIKIKTIIIGFIFSLLNPQGLQIYNYAFKMLFTNASKATNSIAEWQPLQFIGVLGALLFLLILCSFAFCKKNKELDKEVVTKIIIISFWAIAMLRYCRCTPIFLFVVLLWGYEFIKDFIELIVNEFHMQKLFLVFKYIVFFFSLIYIILTLVMFIKWINFYFKHTNEEIISTGYSYDAINYFKENNIKTKIFNDDWGCWLLFNEIPTFVDGRCDPFVNEFSPGNNQFIEVANAEKLEDYLAIFKKYDIEYIYMKKDEDLCTLFESTGNWKKILLEDRTMLLKRVN